jgi:uncharacterized membrane protein
MTDASAVTPAAAEEDKVLPAVVYGLYLLAFSNGVTAVIGLIVAYLNRDHAGPINQSHYTFAIRTFWIGTAAMLATGVLFLVGLVLTLIVIGIPILVLAGALASIVCAWFALRCVAGIYFLVKGEAYPRPLAWLI